ncbi:DUF6056 family protein [Streptomyces sp. MMS24-I29]|uniref:DUF6056 family protein n=1 Tax=Streptomyces sp. MMS24-I29 TaxID=3351480 RepID=UPI003C7D36FD
MTAETPKTADDERRRGGGPIRPDDDAEAAPDAGTASDAGSAPDSDRTGRCVTNRIPVRALPLLTLLPLALLGAAFWIGRLVRPGADDWCFLPVVRDEGATGMIAKFYLQDNGRVANALLVVAYGAFGVAGHQWFALVSGVIMLGVLWALVASALSRARLTAPRGLALLVAATATAVFLLSTSNTYKVFYWPASSVSHTVSPVLACAAVIPLLRARTRRGWGLALGVALVAGVFIGTLSEETAVVVLVLLAAVLLLSLRAVPGPTRTRTRVWCGGAVAGVVIGAAILYLSPGARTRRERFGADSTTMLGPRALGDALRSFADILGTVLTTWQYLGAVAVGVLLGLLVRHDGRERDGRGTEGPGTDGRGTEGPGTDGRRTEGRRTEGRRTEGPGGPWPGGPLGRRPLVPLLVGFLAFLVAGYLCTIVARPAFGTSVALAPRVWGDFLLLYVLLLVCAGALLGRALLRRARRSGRRARGARTVTVTAAVAAALCALTCVGLAVPLFRLEQRMDVRAQRWDRQDRSLREGAARGARVLPYTPVSVSGMGEPFGGNGKRLWPGQCVARYYHLERITYSTRLP